VFERVGRWKICGANFPPFVLFILFSKKQNHSCYNLDMKKMNKNLIIYQAKNGAIEFRGDFKGENVIWGSLNQIAELFGVQKAAISKHLKNIYDEKELDRESTVSILETVQKEGGREVVRKITYYNLDAIISVGYRVNSKTATEFRI